ncbi:pentatricopeptide repeat-containing protein [Hibiscus syriacus]|uniref:Pentatricopeptide repeat-containing protein n=1 Tax=Hibiscus syriacus TaxID=106335 RepID=A0A6A2YWM6_HIBSY|nr:pentatricopeptide repeat-containing protein [Hibiscus syriacus]
MLVLKGALGLPVFFISLPDPKGKLLLGVLYLRRFVYVKRERYLCQLLMQSGSFERDLTAASKPCSFGEKTTSDVILRLTNGEGRPEWFCSHSSVHVTKSRFFANQLSNPDFGSCTEIHCSNSTYDHHVNLLSLLYLPSVSLLDSLDSVESALGVLNLAVSFHCDDVTNCCIQYLEAVPWDDKEEEQIIKAVSKLGPIAMPILARIQPVDLSATKNVFISAVRFATSIGGRCPPFGDELKTSAQEQVEFMLGGDEETPLVTGTADDEVKLVGEMSGKVLGIIEDKKLDNAVWGLELKLIEVTGKVLEAVGYGNVILPALCRVQLLKTWLPYIRKIKPLLDSESNKYTDFPYKMDEDLCQSIEGAIDTGFFSLCHSAFALYEVMHSRRTTIFSCTVVIAILLYPRIQQIIGTRCSSLMRWPYLCWWSRSSPTCTRSVYSESMPIIELRWKL